MLEDAKKLRHTYCVMRGLDPRIHQSSKDVFWEDDGLPGLRLAEGASAPQAGQARQ
jgi:hypothetical protein